MSSEDEIVTQVGKFPEPPPQYKDSYFADAAKYMAELAGEVRKYNENLEKKIKNDDTHWNTIQHEISGLRTSMEDFKNQVSGEVRNNTDKVTALETRLTTLEQRFEEHLAKTG